MQKLCCGLSLCLAFSGVFAQSGAEKVLSEVQLDWSRSVRPELGRTAPRSIQDVSPPSSGDTSGVAQLWAVSLQDKTLYRVMRRWAAQAQYQLVWQIDRDFPIESEVVFEGTFRKAVSEVMVGVSMTDYPLQAIFNLDTRVLRVVRFLEERDVTRR